MAICVCVCVCVYKMSDKEYVYLEIQAEHEQQITNQFLRRHSIEAKKRDKAQPDRGNGLFVQVIVEVRAP